MYIGTGLPFPLTCDPFALLYLAVGLDEPCGTKSFCCVLKVLLDLGARGIHFTPVGVGSEGVLVGMGFMVGQFKWPSRES